MKAARRALGTPWASAASRRGGSGLGQLRPPTAWAKPWRVSSGDEEADVDVVERLGHLVLGRQRQAAVAPGVRRPPNSPVSCASSARIGSSSAAGSRRAPRTWRANPFEPQPDAIAVLALDHHARSRQGAQQARQASAPPILRAPARQLAEAARPRGEDLRDGEGAGEGEGEAVRAW